MLVGVFFVFETRNHFLLKENGACEIVGSKGTINLIRQKISLQESETG